MRQQNVTIDTLLSNGYMVGHTMFNVLRDGNLSLEAITAYTDTAGAIHADPESQPHTLCRLHSAVHCLCYLKIEHAHTW
jgi:hypothetical protein